MFWHQMPYQVIDDQDRYLELVGPDNDRMTSIESSKNSGLPGPGDKTIPSGLRFYIIQRCIFWNYSYITISCMQRSKNIEQHHNQREQHYIF